MGVFKGAHEIDGYGEALQSSGEMIAGAADPWPSLGPCRLIEYRMLCDTGESQRSAVIREKFAMRMRVKFSVYGKNCRPCVKASSKFKRQCPSGRLFFDLRGRAPFRC